MYAVIKTGGKQYRVQAGQLLKIEKLEHELGAQITFDEVLLVGQDDQVTIGEPLIKKAKVTAEVVLQGRHPKIRIIKFKRRKHHMKTMGHRQWFTQVRITGIKAA